MKKKFPLIPSWLLSAGLKLQKCSHGFPCDSEICWQGSAFLHIRFLLFTGKLPFLFITQYQGFYFIFPDVAIDQGIWNILEHN